MAATIKDIAKAVGVSPSTVSRVINGTAPISDEMKEKVRATMKELDYHPNSGARILATGSTNTIALVIDAEDEKTFSNTFFNRSVFAIERMAQKNGYNLLITNDGGKKATSVKELVYEKKVDGMIIPSSSAKEKLVKFLEKEQIPWVMLGEPDIQKENIYWVDIDNYKGSRLAVKHLLQQGYRNIAYVTDSRTTMFARRRIEGFCEEMLIHGLEMVERQIISAEAGYEKLEDDIISAVEQTEVDAFICSNNELAYHVLRGVKRITKRITNNVGMVTFDNQPLAEYMEPPLSAVDVDTYCLGEQAAKMLIGRIKREKNLMREGVIEPKLIERESSKRK